MRSYHVPAALSLALTFSACGETEEPPTDPPSERTVRSELARDLTPDVPAADLQTLTDGNHALAVDLYQELDTDDSNLLVSPLSIRMAFGLLQAGARGETATEIADVLHYGLEGDALHAAFNSLDLTLASRNDPGDADHDPIALRTANAFWGQTGYAWNTDYLDTIALNYGAGVETLDYDTDAEGARETINTWVEDATENRIVDLLPDGSLNSGTVAVLTNALYLKAPWATPFIPALTVDGDFNSPGGAVSAEFMNQLEAFGYVDGDGYQALEMNYRLDELSMVFVLPDEGQFDAFEDALTHDTFADIAGSLETTMGDVAIPKFEFEASFSLGAALQALGMETAFLSADLSGMIDNGSLFIDAVYHKTFIAVDELGTEAAAATAIVVGETSAPTPEFSFRADRPFMFFIRDRETGTVLFLGRVMDPS